MDSWMHSPWFWWGMALALFAAEALLPGAFLLWLGFAALATALLGLVLPISLTAQWLVFGLLALVAVAIGWKLRQRNPPQPTDHPLLNQRGAQLVGQVYALDSAIIDGRGRLKIGDAFWRAEGADLPAGTKVRVVRVDAGVVKVEAA